MTATSSPFALTISLNVLEHLGINLYSNLENPPSDSRRYDTKGGRSI
jgi:hypothetical protein